MPGVFDPRNHPLVPIKVHGAFPQAEKQYNAMIDTGFTGFLSMPLAYAMEVALVLASTATYNLADGRPSTTLLCWGNVEIEGVALSGLISIFPGDQILIGVELLKKLNKKFILDFPNNNIEFI